MHDGRYTTVAVDAANDLMEVRHRIQSEVWVNVYRASDGTVYTGQSHRSASAAAGYGGYSPIARIPLTINCEEGEGL